ncbi:hypothetical protein CF326_g7570 [Tilletia indica]|nr:hypothetical protein CF326_g7570 [Tilletia indica]
MQSTQTDQGQTAAAAGGGTSGSRSAPPAMEPAEPGVVCYCTACRPYPGAAGRLRSRGTRANHISADQRRFELYAYDTGPVVDFLHQALRDNLAQADSDYGPGRGRHPGGRNGLLDAAVGGTGARVEERVDGNDGVGDDPMHIEPDGEGPDEHADLDRNEQPDEQPDERPQEQPQEDVNTLSTKEKARHQFFRDEARWERDFGRLERGDERAGGEDNERTSRYHMGNDNLQALLAAEFPIKHHPFVVPEDPPSDPPDEREYSVDELETLDHLNNWVITQGKVPDFEIYARALRRCNLDIPTLHLAQQLALNESGLEFETYEMCPVACVAFLIPRSASEPSQVPRVQTRSLQAWWSGASPDV